MATFWQDCEVSVPNKPVALTKDLLALLRKNAIEKPIIENPIILNKHKSSEQQ